MNLVVLVGLPVLLGAPFDNPVFIVIGNLAMLVPTLACFGYAFVRRSRRGPAIWLGFAMLSQAAGNVIYSAWTQYQAHPPVPAPSDIAYLGFYVSVAVAVVWLARREHGSFPRAVVARRSDRRRGRGDRARRRSELAPLRVLRAAPPPCSSAGRTPSGIWSSSR